MGRSSWGVTGWWAGERRELRARRGWAAAARAAPADGARAPAGCASPGARFWTQVSELVGSEDTCDAGGPSGVCLRGGVEASNALLLGTGAEFKRKGDQSAVAELRSGPYSKVPEASGWGGARCEAPEGKVIPRACMHFSATISGGQAPALGAEFLLETSMGAGEGSSYWSKWKCRQRFRD